MPMAENADYPAISRVFAAILRILVRIPPACIGDIPPERVPETTKQPGQSNGQTPLLIAWITAALRSVGPHPILVITGEQGAARSTLARVCRLLTDPHTAPLRAEPKDHRDLMVATLNG